MSEFDSPAVVGNDFLVAQEPIRVRVEEPQTIVIQPAATAVAAAVELDPLPIAIPAADPQTKRRVNFGGVLDVAHHYSIASFALLFLLVGSTGTLVVGKYATARVESHISLSNVSHHVIVQPKSGINTMVPAGELAAKIEAVASQPLAVTVGTKPVAVGHDTIKGWLQAVTDQKHNVSYIHVNQTAVQATFDQMVKDNTVNPVNQVSTTHDDGTGGIIASGKNGSKPGDPTELVSDITKNVLGAKGFQLNLPSTSIPFQAVTPAAFDKMIEVNVTSKQMYLYDHGTISKSYPISAGAPTTPTPIGQYHIFSKLAVQDMSGFNANGTKYFQPHVRWINYFLPGGYAIHGNYWRPQSWFGNINSSHGCASLPDAQAKEVYDWAPLGTTVITHA